MSAPGPDAGPVPPGASVLPASDPAAAAARLCRHLGVDVLAGPDDVRRVVAEALTWTTEHLRRQRLHAIAGLAGEVAGHDAADDRALLARAAEIRLDATLLDASDDRADLDAVADSYLAALFEHDEAGRGLAAAERRLREPSGPGRLDLQAVRRAAAMATAAAERSEQALASLGDTPSYDEDALEVARAAEHHLAMEVERWSSRRLRQIAVAGALAVALVTAGAAGRLRPAAVVGAVVVALVIVGIDRGRLVRARRAAETDLTACLGRVEATDAAELPDREATWAAYTERAAVVAEADRHLLRALATWQDVAGPDLDPAQVENVLAADGSELWAIDVHNRSLIRHRAAVTDLSRARQQYSDAYIDAGLEPPAPDEARTLLRRLGAMGDRADEIRSSVDDLVAAERRADARHRLEQLLGTDTLDGVRDELARPAPPPPPATVLVHPVVGDERVSALIARAWPRLADLPNPMVAVSSRADDFDGEVARLQG